MLKVIEATNICLRWASPKNHIQCMQLYNII